MTGTPRVVLLVEDELDLRTVIEELLIEEGFQVVCAADGVAALDWVSAGGKPSLVLLDFFMPRLSGDEFIQRLRAIPALERVPLVAMSGAEVKHADLTASLRKPFELFDLVDLVHALARAP
ncbi:response regulator [[Archangium] primigenium]|jgi:CheY-like chemotaxis protein|uniref:response regulator n=1 Tax=Melittangium TaxID=44 RepID=UPI001959BE8E|nr:response regulator [Archangium primigenium]MBM7114282.1 response regulator [Archangium primigenium]